MGSLGALIRVRTQDIRSLGVPRLARSRARPSRSRPWSCPSDADVVVAQQSQEEAMGAGGVVCVS